DDVERLLLHGVPRVGRLHPRRDDRAFVGVKRQHPHLEEVRAAGREVILKPHGDRRAVRGDLEHRERLLQVRAERLAHRERSEEGGSRLAVRLGDGRDGRHHRRDAERDHRRDDDREQQLDERHARAPALDERDGAHHDSPGSAMKSSAETRSRSASKTVTRTTTPRTSTPVFGDLMSREMTSTRRPSIQNASGYGSPSSEMMPPTGSVALWYLGRSLKFSAHSSLSRSSTAIAP